MSIRDLIPLQRRLIGLDLETTGVNKSTARIVEIAFIEIKPDGTEREWQSLINPGIPIPREASAVHHINDADVMSKPTFAQIASSLMTGLTDVDFYGFNIRFDLDVLVEEFKRVGLTWTYANARILDGFRLWQIGSPRTLSDAVAEFINRDELSNGEAHTALTDIRRTGVVIEQQLERWREKLPRELGRLHELQFPKVPGAIDEGARFVWQGDVPTINFGKHRGTPLRQVDKGFLGWMLKQDFPEGAKRIARDAMQGIYPKKEAA